MVRVYVYILEFAVLFSKRFELFSVQIKLYIQEIGCFDVAIYFNIESILFEEFYY